MRILNIACSLAALLAVVANEVAVLEENLAQLDDDLFIETASPWAVPYIGDLIGYRTVHGGGARTRARAEVAHTIAFRRRKGTAAMLEQLARDVTGWNARVVEFFAHLATTRAEPLVAICGASTLIATIRCKHGSNALSTTPMPPRPITCVMR